MLRSETIGISRSYADPRRGRTPENRGGSGTNAEALKPVVP